jgi:hypothetical protein
MLAQFKGERKLAAVEKTAVFSLQHWNPYEFPCGGALSSGGWNSMATVSCGV